MFQVNEDNSIYVTRGDAVYFSVTAVDNGEAYTFVPGDVLRIKIFEKKNCEGVVLEKDFPIFENCTSVAIYLGKSDTKIGRVISKPTDYWYEVEVDPYGDPKTIIGYGEDGPALFKLFPEGADIEDVAEKDSDIPFVDTELSLTSPRPVANRAITARIVAMERDLAKDYVTPQTFGAIGNGVADDTDAIQKALSTGNKMCLPAGVYKVTAPLVAYNSVEFDKDAYIEFYASETATTCLKVNGEKVHIGSGLSCSIDGRVMTVNVEGLSAGDYVYLSNDEKAAPTARDTDTKRDILQIESVGDGTITFTSAPVYGYSVVNIDKLNMVDNIVIDGVKIRCMQKVSYSNGLSLEYCKNATVKNCHISNFDYGQININYCALCDVHSNLCEVNYAESLQYGIVVLSSVNIAVFGNKVNSRRTAIDVTYMSNKVTVNGNTTIGHINTHSCTNTNITNNTIKNGMILIRGKNVLVSGNNVECYDLYCIDIQEMGIEGGHIITNNIFKGYCSMKSYYSNISITNNHFIVEKVSTYGDEQYQSVIRVMTAGSPWKEEGCVISGNTFDAVGIKPMYCIETMFNTNTIHNLVVQDNVIRGFENGLFLSQNTTTLGENLIVKNNLIKVTGKGIIFRLVNNTQIVGNTIVGVEKGSEGISRLDTPEAETVGLIIRDNYIKNFNYGLRVNGGGDMKKAVCMDNVFVDCTTASTGVSGNTQRVGNEIFARSPNGTVFYLRVDDAGTLTVVNQGYTV